MSSLDLAHYNAAVGRSKREKFSLLKERLEIGNFFHISYTLETQQLNENVPENLHCESARHFFAFKGNTDHSKSFKCDFCSFSVWCSAEIGLCGEKAGKFAYVSLKRFSTGMRQTGGKV